ncbi:MAG: hydantoinase/oxoprolinase N-terminal domain-containing protein, partial [Phycisphaerales bacterium]
MPRPAWRIGVDVGGTFAAAVAVSPDGEVRRIKLFTDGRWRLACEPAAGGVRVAGVPAWAVAALAGCSATAADGQRHSIRSATVAGGGVVISLVPPSRAAPAWIDVDASCEAPVLAAHLACGVPPGMPLPAIDLRIGTTRGTNALLEGRLDRVAAFVDEGLEGLLEIGTQQRRGLFDLVPQVPPRIAAVTLGVPGRLAADGTPVGAFDSAAVRRAARAARDAGCTAAAAAHPMAGPLSRLSFAANCASGTTPPSLAAACTVALPMPPATRSSTPRTALPSAASTAAVCARARSRGAVGGRGERGGTCGTRSNSPRRCCVPISSNPSSPSSTNAATRS